MTDHQFKIYNASAGSGKTFTLVKEYLKILLATEQTESFKQILAITFTNKAVAEMKERVLHNLKQFSDPGILEEPTDMFQSVATELKCDHGTLFRRSNTTLKAILHNYSSFDIVTIDKFNHRLLRTFAFDLKLPMNFEVALDTELLIREAVDNLIFQAGDNELLTATLIAYALEKADDDKSWDISADLYKAGMLLTSEVHYEKVKELENFSLQDFKILTQELRSLISSLSKKITAACENTLEIIHTNGLDATNFSRGTLYNHFQNVATGKWNALYSNNLEQNLADRTDIYKKTESDAIKSVIDSLLPEIEQAYLHIKGMVYQLLFLKNFYKNIVPLSLLNSINQMLNSIKKEQDLVLISDFNNTISTAIASQPAPFIYERIGEKYRHYFIDEFQDTSRMQWENLKPLIANALESESLSGKRGSLMIVGDAKQSIYRWRGGKTEQFIDLYNRINPFQIPEHITSLPVNYRSHEEVIKFNNGFFCHISQFLSKPDYRDLFENHSRQELNSKKGGYINLSFLEKDESSDEAYCEAVLQQIRKIVSGNFNYSDICILTRKNAQGSAIASFLTQNEVPVISSESLLLKNDRKIDFLINLISQSVWPDRKEFRAKILHFIAEKLRIPSVHEFISSRLDNFDAFLKEQGFEGKTFEQLPFLMAAEYAINTFSLTKDSDAYIQYFLDIVLEFDEKHSGGMYEFLLYWEKKKDKLSIVAPEGANAVQIMTIHKAKGLEFPVVIYPFADTAIYNEVEPRIWFPVDQELFGIKNALLNKNNDLAELNETGKLLIDDHGQKVELDQFNLLYVVLTRAVEQLYVISKKDSDPKRGPNLRSFAGLFISYLQELGMWNETQLCYEFGNPVKVSAKNVQEKFIQQEVPYISNASFNSAFRIVTRAASLWDSNLEKAIEKGNLYHFLLSRIITISDFEQVFEDAALAGIIDTAQLETLRTDIHNLLEHPQLRPFFTSAYQVYTEKEIYTASGESLRPDRINISADRRATILDYKTGGPSPQYIIQINQYAEALEQMGFDVEHKFLIFINDKIEVTAV